MVQGVGFRPFVFRTALKHGLAGKVDNRTDGVYIIVKGESMAIDRFTNELLNNAPPASHIRSIEMIPIQVSGYENFIIAESVNTANQVTEVSPDIAVCSECLEDMESDPERIMYPFVNCTNCGPRFTIIEELPYDRPGTSMRDFTMCNRCSSQYEDTLDRRFHAQPIACNSCGPVYKYKDQSGCITDISDILERAAFIIDSGNTVAVKGLGGYHLLCDAFNNNAVTLLRKRKQRDSKPFAVMFMDVATADEYCCITKEEREELLSWRRPVVILSQRKELSPAVSNGLKTTGALIPYMPFYYLLFGVLKTRAIVFTSGNIADEPVITDDKIADEKLSMVANSIISYNRTIVNRADDSVVRIIDKKTAFIRRSRGYVPQPVELKIDVDGIIALGAEQKNCFCIGKGTQAILSQFIGDVKNRPTFDFFVESFDRFKKLFRFKPELIACDLHPDYLSTRYAEELEKELNIPIVRVQHHHAHIVSCMAENGLEGEVIGISLDGTGMGTDGNIWGGEFLIADINGFRRFTHFDYIPLPGGDKAADEPWRMAFSYLYKYLRDDFDYDSVEVFRMIEKKRFLAVKEMLDKNISSPLSSGAGRLFDVVSALTGLCIYSAFDSEAPMRLESAIIDDTDASYPFVAGKPVVFSEMLKEILRDMSRESISIISAKFHNTVARVISAVSKQIRTETGINRITLSGGVFQNKYLVEKTVALLHKDNFDIYTNNQVPANDGGISLGQLVIASKIK